MQREPSDSVEEAAHKRGVSLGALVKTLVVRRGQSDYVFVLVGGDRAIDWAKLRRHLDVRRLSLPDADEAREATGYERGTITPFGATTAWPVVVDAALVDQDEVSLGGGAHGVSVTMTTSDLVDALDGAVVEVSKAR